MALHLFVNLWLTTRSVSVGAHFDMRRAARKRLAWRANFVFGARRKRYHRRVQDSSTIELHGTVTLGELMRFQYFHILRRLWFLAAILVPGLPVTIFLIVASSDTDRVS